MMLATSCHFKSVCYIPTVKFPGFTPISSADITAARVSMHGSGNPLVALDLSKQVYASPHGASDDMDAYGLRPLLAPRPEHAPPVKVPLSTGLLSIDKTTLRTRDNAYILGPIIGQGSYGIVRLAVKVGAHADAGELVVLKEFALAALKNHMLKEQRLPFALHEYTMMQAAGSPLAATDLVCTYDARGDAEALFATMPPMQGDAIDATNALLSQTPEITRLWARHVFITLAKELVRLKTNRVLHADIKPENLLLDTANDLHLGDFGLARRLSEAQPNRGSFEYAAPEQLTGRFNEQADVFAAGVSVLNILSGINPLESLDADEPIQIRDAYLARRTLRGWHEAELAGRRFSSVGRMEEFAQRIRLAADRAKAADPALYAIVFRMLAGDGNARPTAEQLAEVASSSQIALSAAQRAQLDQALANMTALSVGQHIARARRA